MGITAAAVLALSLQGVTPPPDSSFADAATRDLIRRAAVRHRAQDSAVTDYQALLRYRLSFSLGRRRWARIPIAAVEEQEAVVHWQLPNDLRVDVKGTRSKARREDWNINSVMETPWFFPRGIGDSVSFFGNEFPERAALHPLASDGPAWYHYALTDSVRLFLPSGKEFRMLKVIVVPLGTGPSLIVGNMWLDAETAEVVRLTFRFVGTEMWEVPDLPSDSSDARTANKIINRILSVDADIEYSLQDGQYWMPYRQVVSGRVQIPIISDIVIPFEAQTTFQDYEINTGRPVVFTVPGVDSAAKGARGNPSEVAEPNVVVSSRGQRGRRYFDDSTQTVDYVGNWAGGRFQVHRAPPDSLRDYAWADSLTLDPADGDDDRIREAEAEVARLAEGLPSDMTGIRRRGIAYERFADILRFNRVQGLSVGLGYAVKVPRVSFTNVMGTVRYGTSDGKLNGRLSLIRDAPGGRLTVHGYYEVAEVDRFFRVKTLGNSVNALITSHDEADYYQAAGGSIEFETSVSRGLQLTLFGRIEDQSSVTRQVGSGLNGLWSDNGFPPNPAVTEGTFGVVGWRFDGTAGRASWRAATDLFVGSATMVGRVYASWRQPLPEKTRLTLGLDAGVATSGGLSQSLYRAGGLQTVRGLTYGTQRGQAFWAARADWAPFDGDIQPVAFLDAGQAAPVGSISDQSVLVGAGAGVSFFDGLVRFDLSGPLNGGSGQGLRFDIVFGAVR